MTDEPTRTPRPVSARPQSVRAGLVGDTSHPEIPVASRELEMDGVSWTVQLVGRARVRTGGAGTPLLDLLFQADGRDDLEALFVGRSLEALTDDQIEEAFRSARIHQPDPPRQGFFEGTEQSGGRPRRPG